MNQPLYGGLPSSSSIRRRRQLADALLSQATDASPVGHWTQALARGLQGGIAGWQNRKADREEGTRSQALADALGGNMTPEEMQNFGILNDMPDVTQVGTSRMRAADNNSKYGNSLYTIRGPNGELRYVQPFSEGGVRDVPLPPGFQPSETINYLNQGTQFSGMGSKSGQPGPVVPINNAQKAADTELGQQQGATKAALPAAEQNLQNTLTEIDQVLAHPGLNAGVGTWQGQVPDAVAGFFSGDVADFRTRVNQLKSRTFLQAYDILKGAGPIAVAESENAKAAIARLNTATNEADFKKALEDFRGAVQRGFVAMQQKAGMSGGMPVPPPQGVVPPPPPDQLQPGMIVDGHIFMGGDPSKPESWQEQ